MMEDKTRRGILKRAVARFSSPGCCVLNFTRDAILCHWSLVGKMGGLWRVRHRRRSRRDEQVESATRETMVRPLFGPSYLRLDVQRETGLRMPVLVFLRTRPSAQLKNGVAFDKTSQHLGSPAFRDGPTSARFCSRRFRFDEQHSTKPAV